MGGELTITISRDDADALTYAVMLAATLRHEQGVSGPDGLRQDYRRDASRLDSMYQRILLPVRSWLNGETRPSLDPGIGDLWFDLLQDVEELTKRLGYVCRTAERLSAETPGGDSTSIRLRSDLAGVVDRTTRGLRAVEDAAVFANQGQELAAKAISSGWSPRG